MSRRPSSVARRTGSLARTLSLTPSRSIASMFARAIAQLIGWPPKVKPCMKGGPPSLKGSATRFEAITAPIAAYAPARPLAVVMRSGR